jgi:thiamine biosynthesis lipoprotein
MMLTSIKKIGMMVIVFAIAITFSACDTSEEMHSITFYDYMYTSITVSLYATENEADTHFEKINDMYAMYDALTNNYEGLPSDSTYLENIYTINQQKGVTLEIDVALYDLIQEALSIQALTEGYFNIGLGKPVKAWKTLISNTPKEVTVGSHLYVRTYDSTPIYEIYEVTEITETTYALSDGETTDIYDINKLIYDIEVTQTAFEQTMTNIDAMSIENNDILLETSNHTYYITISGSDIELDVGAFSKGYTTEKVKQYLLEQEVTYFSISAGSSTISVGQNINRPSQDEVYIVSLTDPITSLPFFKEPYGLIHIKNQSLATSGNFEQFTMYEGKRYHHLISPFTLSPTHDYAALTIIGDDAGLLDALSTALFVMPKDVFDRFMETHQTSLNIQVIRYNTDNTIDKFISDLYFEDLMS